MERQILLETQKLSAGGKLKFPEVVKKLAATGIQRYEVDLVRLEATYYSDGKSSDRLPFALEEGGTPAPEFSAEKVKQAITASRLGEISYPDFLRRIIAAGTVSYSVFIFGMKVIYWGRLGDFHVEPFPPAPGK